MDYAAKREYICKTSYDAEKKIWSGMKLKPFYGPECTLGGEILKALLKDPQRIAQICHHNGRTYTKGEIARISISISQHFKKLNIAQCEVIGIVAGKTDYLAPLVYGVWLSGLIISTLEPKMDKDAIKRTFSLTQPKIVFAIGSEYKRAKECLAELGLESKIYLLNEFKDDLPTITEFFHTRDNAVGFQEEPLKYGWNQTAAILSSSGTTGAPKAICASHTTLLNKFTTHFYEADDIILGGSTIYWIIGLTSLLNVALSGCAEVINEDGFPASILHEVMQKYKITAMFASARTLTNILEQETLSDRDFSTMRVCSTGGCHAPFALIKKVQVLMPKAKFILSYGSTENNGILTIGRCNALNHSGQLVPNREIKIIDNDDNHLGPGEVGEICGRSTLKWPGYYKNSELTATVYKNGWIHTGDLGYMDEEGNLYVVDRKNDIIKYKEKIIYPQELENIIHEIPGIADVCVCGVTSVNDDRLPAAAVIKAKNSDLSEKHIYDYVAERVSDEKKLRGGVFLTNYIPKTLTGKHVRFRCAEYCQYFGLNA